MLEQRQLLRRADAGEHQQLRGLVGAGGQDDLARGVDLLDRPGVVDLDAAGAVAVEEDPQRERVGDDRQVLALHGRMQVAHRRARAHAVLLRHLVAAEALLARAVEVGVPLVAGLRRRPR